MNPTDHMDTSISEKPVHNKTRHPGKIRISIATDQDRLVIYRLRHEVYASELAQHIENQEGELRDSLDMFNTYITASLDGEIVGFISITPPSDYSYSIDKYLSRDSLPFSIDDSMYEIRLLTVVKQYRNRLFTPILMYAAFRWVQAHGGKRIIAIGRVEVLDIYLRVGLQPMNRKIQSGAVTFKLLSGQVDEICRDLKRYTGRLNKLSKGIIWELDIPFFTPAKCYHGGMFFDAIGTEFDKLDRRQDIINADVLDAWFPPSPKILDILQKHLSWIARTSPPTDCNGMTTSIAHKRGVKPENILPGAGSSDLIFLAFRQWLTSSSRVLVLDPTYGEYTHILENVIGSEVDRLTLLRDNSYALDVDDISSYAQNNYDLIVLVNPNSPTGQHASREKLERALRCIPELTRVWVDETYVEYAGINQSLEHFAAQSENVIVCKSMSKVYALSGLRAAYLCASSHQLEKLWSISPPWAVSLPAQVAAVTALQDAEYYAERYRETRALRNQLVKDLLALNAMEVIPGVANFILCHLLPGNPDAATVVEKCRAKGLFLRDASTMGTQLGAHAIRIAVKDKETNCRIVEILKTTLYG